MRKEDELYVILNKYNLTRTAKEKIIEILIKEKEAILDVLKK